MSHVFPRQKINPPEAVRGEGCYLYDRSGKAYLDGSCGAAVSCLGHGDQDVIAAVQKQASEMAFAHTRFFTSRPAEELAGMLIDNAPSRLDRVYFVSGGSESVEAAIKLARQYYLEIGQPKRSRIVSRRQSYHGGTLGAMAASGEGRRRDPFAPLLPEIFHIAPCYEYAMRREDESAEEYGMRAAQELENEILRLGPETVMAFLAETVVGASLGAVPPVAGYFTRIREICDKYGVLLILDEVMCGTGRTGYLFACEAEGIAPDIVCMAKGLGGGYQPIGATLCTDRIYAAFEEGSGTFLHGHSYLAHPMAAAAGRAVISKLLQQELVGRVAKTGKVLRASLEARFSQHPHVGDIRGRGLFMGIELVEDREAKVPFDSERAIAPRIKTAAFEEGLICYPMAGTRDGHKGDHILLAPPFIIETDQIEELTDKLARAISRVLAAQDVN